MHTTPRPLRQRTTPTYEGQEPTKPVPWHGLVIMDVLLNNLSTGLFLATAAGELAAPEAFAPSTWLAYPVALGLLLADLICLVLDLGDPLRFHHMLRVFKPTSPMSLGTWCLSAFSFPLALLVASDLFFPVPWVHTLAVVLGVLPAVGSAVYKGVLFSTGSQPGWRHARWMGAYFANSAVMLGCAELLLMAVACGHDRAAALSRTALACLLLLNAIPLGLLIADLGPSLARSSGSGRLAVLALLVLGVGMALPMVLLLAGGDPGWTVTAAVLLVLGSLAVRYTIVMLPHRLTDHSGEGGGVESRTQPAFAPRRTPCGAGPGSSAPARARFVPDDRGVAPAAPGTAQGPGGAVPRCHEASPRRAATRSA